MLEQLDAATLHSHVLSTCPGTTIACHSTTMACHSKRVCRFTCKFDLYSAEPLDSIDDVPAQVRNHAAACVDTSGWGEIRVRSPRSSHLRKQPHTSTEEEVKAKPLPKYVVLGGRCRLA